MIHVKQADTEQVMHVEGQGCAIELLVPSSKYPGKGKHLLLTESNALKSIASLHV